MKKTTLDLTSQINAQSQNLEMVPDAACSRKGVVVRSRWPAAPSLEHRVYLPCAFSSPLTTSLCFSLNILLLDLRRGLR